MLKIDYKFKNVSLRQKAMTHSSYANEHHGTHLDCNERLEFLGDSVRALSRRITCSRIILSCPWAS